MTRPLAHADQPPERRSGGEPPVFDFRPGPSETGEATETAGEEPSTDLRPPPADRDGAQAEFYVKLGQKALREGDTSVAAEDFNRARIFDNSNAEAIAGLGAVAFQQGNFGDATVHVDAALRLAPRSARLHVLRGRIALAAGRRTDAAAAFKKAHELDPNIDTPALSPEATRNP